MGHNVKKINTIDAVKHCVINGLSKANYEYEYLSGGEWLNERGVESFGVANVAREIRSNLHIDPSRVILEMSFREFNEKFVRSRGAPGLFSNQKSRMDITVIDHDERLIGVVEVKTYTKESQWSKDISRVEAVSRRYSQRNKLAFGCFVGFVSEKKGDDSIQKAFDLVKNLSSERNSDPNMIFQRSRYHDLGAVGEWRYGIVGSVFAGS